MELNEEKNGKKLNDDLLVFMRKRSGSEAPRYTARLEKYVESHRKKRRANEVRNRHLEKQSAGIVKKKTDAEDKDGKETSVITSIAPPTKPKSHCGFDGERAASEDSRVSRRHGTAPEERRMRGRSDSQSEPSERCGRRRRRSRCCRRRRRRRSCRRRRRRRSCRRRRRRSCRRRRRRSCRRRRRRRSCRRRRRRRSCRRRRRRRRGCRRR